MAIRQINNEQFIEQHKRLIHHAHPLRLMLLQMKVDDSIQMDRADWKWKTHKPSRICRLVEKKHKLQFDCFELLDKTGWVIKRLK